MKKLIEKFMYEYERRLDYYDQACQHAKVVCERVLRSSGINAIVSARAKSPERLKEKILQRDETKNYETLSDIYADIPDLAGVRLALYFPSQIPDVSALVLTAFRKSSDKEFPRDSNRLQEKSGHKYVFSGYSARHHRVVFKDDDLSIIGERFKDCVLEVQIASVLMHAWSEVEHDLIYKEKNGEPSQAEVEIIDEVNGIVLAGEMALKRLFRAQTERIERENGEFKSLYELATFLEKLFSGVASGSGIEMGDVERLFVVLKDAGLANARQVRRLARPSLDMFEHKKAQKESGSVTMSGLVMDAAASENSNLDLAYVKGRVSDTQILNFLDAFASAYSALFRFTSKPGVTLAELKRRNLVSLEDTERFLTAQKQRNEIVHGRVRSIVSIPSDTIPSLQKIARTIEEHANDLWALGALRFKGPMDRIAIKLNGLSDTNGNVEVAMEPDEDKRLFRVVATGQVCVGSDGDGNAKFRELDFVHTDWEPTPDKAWARARQELDEEYGRLKVEVEGWDLHEPDMDPPD
jgi:ppGpp synthetase/RelA/SpoT-type nucleotidyltranferase